MNKYRLLIGILIILVSCNKPSKNVYFTILLDHPVNEKKLVNNDSLVNLIAPFYYHDTLIAPIINFERIDVTPTAHDSIRNEGIIKALNEWMSGNKKNAQKIEKQLNIAIKKFSFIDEFLTNSPASNFTDSVIANRYRSNLLIFTNSKKSYAWVNSTIEVFDTVEIIHDHIGNLVLDNKNDNKHIYIYYKPKKLQKLNIVVIGSDIDSDNDGVPDSKDSCIKISGPANNNGCPINKVIPPITKHKTNGSKQKNTNDGHGLDPSKNANTGAKQ